MSNKINLTFLGTSGSIPTKERNHTSILLTYKGENILIDCGEGTQRQFRKANLNPCKITKILITHWHGDHVLGLPGLFQTLAFNGYSKDLILYGPKGTKTYIKKMIDTFAFVNKFPFKVVELEREGIFFENDEFYLESKKMIHNISCNAYCFIKKGEIRIDKNKLKKSEIPPGPLLQNLKQGKDIMYKNKKFKFKDLTFKEEDIKVSFVLDSLFDEKIIPFVKNSDLLICESTFLDNSDQGEELAKNRFHLTAKQAGEIAKKSNSKKLILTHVSQRYDSSSGRLIEEAKKVFKNAFLVDDLYVAKI